MSPTVVVDEDESAGDPMLAALAQISEALGDAAIATEETARAIRESEQRRQRSNVIAVIVAVILILLLIGVLVGLRAITDTQNSIKDCTDPTRATATCAREGQRRTGEAIQNIVHGQLAVKFATDLCEDKNDDVTLFRTCIETNLQAIADGTLKAPALPTPAPTR